MNLKSVLIGLTIAIVGTLAAIYIADMWKSKKNKQVSTSTPA